MPDPKKPTTAKGHRVIGIRHALRHLKQAGLVEEDVLFPADAVSDVQAAKTYKLTLADLDFDT